MEQAGEAFVPVVAVNPRHSAAWNKLGTAYSGRGRADEAVDSYRKALEIEPGFAEAHSNYAELMRNMGRLDIASEHYQQAFDSALGNRLRVLNATMLPPVYESMEDLLHWRERVMNNLDDVLATGLTLDPAREWMQTVVTSVRRSPGFQRRRNRHWLWKARWWLCCR